MHKPVDDLKIHSISHLVGNTPLLEIEFYYNNEPRTIYAKAENMNMTGSIKDRMAIHIIKKAYSRGAIREGSTIIEATSGNTGISFSALGRALGHQVIIFMPDWMSRERIELIKSLGAKINLVSKEEGGFLGSINQAGEFAKLNENTFLPRQFSNEDNCNAHFETTGPEIWWQMRFRSLKPDAFVAGVGTGGTIMGVGKYLKGMNPKVKIHPLEPANSPTLTTGHKVGKHRIQGISDEFIPPIVDLDFLDEIVSVDDGDAMIMAQKLASQLGIGVGISSGANFIGALKIQNSLGKDAVVVTVFPDDNKKYLSTDLLKDEPAKNDFLSPDVDLLGFGAYKRVCHTCCDPLTCIEADYDHIDEIQLPPCPRRIRTGV
jgi:cysteine synthase A